MSAASFLGTLDEKTLAGVQDFENPATKDENLYRVVDDLATIDRLESVPKMTAYHAMQVIDVRLYPPPPWRRRWKGN